MPCSGTFPRSPCTCTPPPSRQLLLPPLLLAASVPVAAQAAHLCKADLATAMVTEMTALAGTMGRHYALKEGLPAGGCVGRGQSVGREGWSRKRGI